MDRDTTRWLIVSATLMLWAGLSGGALLPVSLLGLALAATAHPPTRRQVETLSLGLFSYGFFRGLFIVIAGAMFIQLLPLELALFAAADIIAYLEVVAALALVSTQLRLRTLRNDLAQRVRPIVTPLLRHRSRAERARRVRPPRSPSSDDPEGWAFA